MVLYLNNLIFDNSTKRLRKPGGHLRSLTCFLNVCYKQGTPTEYLMIDHGKHNNKYS